MIILKNVNKYYETGGERVHAVRNLSVTFPDTGLAFILGPSGSGKSTLLNLLGGLDLPSEGEIWIEDKEISTFTSKERTNYLNSYLGFVLQEYNILLLKFKAIVAKKSMKSSNKFLMTLN